MSTKKCVTEPIPEKIHDFNVFLLAPNYLSLRDFSFLLVFLGVPESQFPGPATWKKLGKNLEFPGTDFLMSTAGAWRGEVGDSGHQFYSYNLQ